jgi:2-keto-4-pentenoate hydratase/2-oxohepta-3-ene-1,7-dioic acid hydratase in catechol pathway
MRLVSFTTHGGPPQAGVLLGERVLPIAGATDVTDLLLAPDGLEQAQAALASGHKHAQDQPALGEVVLLPPVHRPSKVLGVGMNYRSFLAQMGEAVLDHPTLFHKTSSALTAAGAPIVIPPVTDQAVPEGELAIVIGRTARAVPEGDAWLFIAGFTCANDVSARNLEFRTSQWTSGKMLETFCPLGPAIVTPDEIPDPQRLTVRTLLNDTVIQHGSTSDMMFGIPRLVSEISALVRLEPGDVILTGTPSDLGELDPPVFLSHGDVVTVEVEQVGVLSNPVVRA